MAGTHLQGEFVLVRLKDDENNWLLIKHRDDYSTSDEYDISKIDAIKSKKKKSTASKTAVKKAVAKKPVAKKAAKSTSKK